MGRQDGGAKLRKIPTPEDEAMAGLYVLEDGAYGMRGEAYRSALLNGLKNKKVGRASAISVFQAAVFSVKEWVTLVDPKTKKPLKEYAVDSRRAIVQRQGVIRSRPRFEEWGAYVPLFIDTEMVSADQVLEHLNVAGRIIGVGDYRIEKRGMFGRFKAEKA